jgi:hypothetical protein
MKLLAESRSPPPPPLPPYLFFTPPAIPSANTPLDCNKETVCGIELAPFIKVCQNHELQAATEPKIFLWSPAFFVYFSKHVPSQFGITN